MGFTEVMIFALNLLFDVLWSTQYAVGYAAFKAES